MSRSPFIVALALPLAAARICEISSSNLFQERSLANIKVKWDGQIRGTRINLEYDHAAKPDFLKEVSVSGETSIPWVDVDGPRYKLSHGFGRSVTALELSQELGGIATLKADFDTASYVKSIGVARSQEVFDTRLDVETAVRPDADLPLHLRASAARRDVLGGDLTLKASMSGNAGEAEVVVSECELCYDHGVGGGRTLRASVKPLGARGSVEVFDRTLESAATWIGKAAFSKGSGAELTLRRAWAW